LKKKLRLLDEELQQLGIPIASMAGSELGIPKPVKNSSVAAFGSVAACCNALETLVAQPGRVTC
jgi:hypothetical protein